MDIIRRHIVFHGWVQGVGFRYTAKYQASARNVTGWVRNLADGSVEMEAEGSPEAVSGLISAMEQHSFGAVTEIETDDIPPEHDLFFDIL